MPNRPGLEYANIFAKMGTKAGVGPGQTFGAFAGLLGSRAFEFQDLEPHTFSPNLVYTLNP